MYCERKESWFGVAILCRTFRRSQETRDMRSAIIMVVFGEEVVGWFMAQWDLIPLDQSIRRGAAWVLLRESVLKALDPGE
jgi:hypothetical protein